MEKNHKGQAIIHSLDELTLDQRKQIRLASRGVGLLALVVVLLAYLAFGSFPSKSDSLFFYCIDWLLFVAKPLAAFGFGACIGFDLMLSDLGFVLSFGHRIGVDSSSLNQCFSSDNSPNYYRSSNYSTHVSINPSSGRPMSGSSGMDSSGNPWHTLLVTIILCLV
jgi:hypothetical protein